MADDDYAIIVGIRRYPTLGAPPNQTMDLEGPDRDAADVEDWLLRADGGAVKAEHIRTIASSAYPDPFPGGHAAPRRSQVVKAFRWLDGIAAENSRTMTRFGVGRRLYLYLSGHGFARRRSDGSVFMADANRTTFAHLEAAAWADWFYRATYFDEYVLWMDCCMNPEVPMPPEDVGFGTVQPTSSPPMFSAFAARFPSYSVEARMDDGQVHGAFTWALLTGLRGAAADPVTGEVRSGSLHDYLLNSMRSFMTAEQRQDPQVSKEPDFGPVDDLLLATVKRASSHVTLRFPPAAEGTGWRILTGSPPAGRRAACRRRPDRIQV